MALTLLHCVAYHETSQAGSLVLSQGSSSTGVGWYEQNVELTTVPSFVEHSARRVRTLDRQLSHWNTKFVEEKKHSG